MPHTNSTPTKSDENLKPSKGGCRLVGITGGIGAGKSVVSRILKLRGYSVYDCDRNAQLLMSTNPELKSALVAILGSEAYLPDGTVNKPHMARCIFSDEDMRERVNSAVHSAVREDIKEWKERLGTGVAFVESAVLKSSSLHKIVSETWLVEASEQERLRRVKARNPELSEEQIRARMRAQQQEFAALPHPKKILNQESESLLSQIDNLLEQIEPQDL